MNRRKLQKALGIKPDDAGILDEGSDHPYGCKCDTCRQWWKLVGPEDRGEPTENYGPFTQEEIEGSRLSDESSEQSEISQEETQ